MATDATVPAAASVLDWLLDSDPAIHWQVLRDLTNAPPGQAVAGLGVAVSVALAADTVSIAVMELTPAHPTMPSGRISQA